METTNDNTYLGRHIYDLRIKVGYSQTKLAQLSGVSQSTICNLEKGRAIGRISTINKILEVFGRRLYY